MWNIKICFIAPRLYPYLSPSVEEPAGGAQRQQSMITVELSARGYDVSAIVANYGQAFREEHAGIELVRGVPKTVSGIVSAIRGVFALARAMYRTSSDIYLVRGAPRMAMVAFLIAKALRKRFVFRIANDADVDPAYLRSRYRTPFFSLYQSAVKRMDAVIAQTARQHSLLHEHFGVDAEVIPNGYDLPSPHEIPPHEEREHVLWVGSSDPEKKNPALFLRLANHLPDLEFTMISQPILTKKNLHHKLQKSAASISNLDFVGPVPPQEVHRYFRTATMLVNTSNYEGFPNTFLEAWRYETPVLSLQFDLENLLSRECGGLRAGSLENLVSEVRQLASDVSRRTELGAAGREYMKENYSLSRVVKQYEEAFEQALQA